ncbi:MAG: nucleotidyltransferase family protein [Candidatus Parcubacteria bacterium]|nr:nucleotidyltransferase family protein [Burkholderiales bacterium]
MKVMVLAAGRGQRLRPLTETTPKPLVEVGGDTLLGRHLARLARAGFRQAVINVSHLADKIVARFAQGAPGGIAIQWSRETEPLETAGGLAHARALLGPDPFLLVNSDIWCDYAFSGLSGFDLDGRLAHLVLVPNPAQHPAGDFSLVNGVVGNAEAPRYTYAGIAVISPRLVAGIAAGEKAQLAPLWRAAAERGEVTGELYEGYWNDVGTPERLSALEARLQAGLQASLKGP